MEKTLTQAFQDFIQDAVRRAESGDLFAVQTLSAIVLLQQGWQPDPPGDGETIIDLAAYRLRLAA